MKTSFVAVIFLLATSPAFAQAPDSLAGPLAQPQAQDVGAPADILATPAGHEIEAGVSSYTYVEPGDTRISIHGVKLAAGYTGTASLSKTTHWFAQADVRGTLGNTKYTGWCSPFLITPNGASPNGWALDIGDPSPCTDTGDKDWYAEARGLIGKDVVGQRWAFSPFSGVGLRHLSNGTTGIAGYRTDDYLYVPLGVTSRARLDSQTALSFTVEGDVLLRGWQTTRDSALGGGDVPATPIAPPFTIESFSDVSFKQSRGLAVRASAKFPLTKRWSMDPYYVYWRVSSSPVNDETVAFTVNGITAHEQLGAYEPLNFTHEFGVTLGLHF